MDKEQLEKIKDIINISNFGLTKSEFLREFKSDFTKSIKTIIDHILRVEKTLVEKINKDISGVKSDTDTSLKAIQADLRAFMVKYDTKYSNLEKEQENELKSIKDRVRWMLRGKQGERGKDGKDADEEKIIQEVLNKIEIPESPQNIGIDDVGNLREELEEIRKIKSKGGGGGVSAMGVAQAAKWIVKTEAPSGTINGTNKEFTVSKPRIFAVLAMSLNGEFIAQLPNYTIAGNKITFSEAIPSAYATKDFEITYI